MPPFWDERTQAGVHFIMLRRDSDEWGAVLREAQGAFSNTQVRCLWQAFQRHPVRASDEVNALRSVLFMPNDASVILVCRL